MYRIATLGVLRGLRLIFRHGPNLLVFAGLWCLPFVGLWSTLWVILELTVGGRGGINDCFGGVGSGGSVESGGFGTHGWQWWLSCGQKYRFSLVHFGDCFRSFGVLPFGTGP